MTSVDSEYEAKVALLIEGCKNAGVRCERVDLYDEGISSLTIRISNGRIARDCTIMLDPRTIDSELALELHKYSFVGDYVAIFNCDNQTIEAAITVPGTSSATVWARALNTRTRANDGESPSPITIPGGAIAPNCTIDIGPWSEEFIRLNGEDAPQSGAVNYTIRVSGVPISGHDDALRKLESLANSLFFQIDLARNIRLALLRVPSRPRPGVKHQREAELPPMEFPRTEYDAPPMALYWYGRSSSDMPLLKYLAYYQCIEFYFPRYYHAQVQRRVRNVLKDPLFRLDKDTDIGRVVAAMNASGGGGRADEKSMLRATMRECIDADVLRTYLEKMEERVKFFSTSTKGLTSIKIPFKDAETDLRDRVADRIYDIRCKIVHTKSGTNDEIELLLPFSKEAEQLDHDIALIEFIAQHVLIAGSSPLRVR